MANVLIVVAHPDDEILGCGGTLAKHVEAGDVVTIHILSRRDLHKQSLEAQDILGYNTLFTSALDDQRFDTYPLEDVIHEIRVSAGVQPDIIYTHWPHDLNLDHSITTRAVLTVFRPKPQARPRRILAFETLSSTEWSHGYESFSPNYYVPLKIEHVTKKVQSMRCYKSEIKEFPHPRSTMGIWTKARTRGSECGHSYAEAFHLVRCVEG